MKTQTEIIIETIQFYLEDPQGRRSTSAFGCHYVKPGSPDTHCAVGRCMTPKALADHGSYLGDVDALVDVAGPLDDLLHVEYRGHPDQFWAGLQRLHDCSSLWEPGEVSARKRGSFVRDMNPDALQLCLDLGLIANPV